MAQITHSKKALAVSPLKVSQPIGASRASSAMLTPGGTEAIREWIEAFGLRAIVVLADDLNTVEEVTFYTKAGGGCAACHEGIEDILV